MEPSQSTNIVNNHDIKMPKTKVKPINYIAKSDFQTKDAKTVLDKFRNKFKSNILTTMSDDFTLTFFDIESNKNIIFDSKINRSTENDIIKSLLIYTHNLQPMQKHKFTTQIENSVLYVFLLPVLHTKKYIIKIGYSKDSDQRHTQWSKTFEIEKENMFLLFAIQVKNESYEKAIHTYIKTQFSQLYIPTEKIENKAFCEETYYFDIKLFQIIMDVLRPELMANANYGKLLDKQKEEAKAKQEEAKATQEIEKTKQEIEKTKQDQAKVRQLELELEILKLRQTIA